MTKIKDLPRSGQSKKSDLITVVQDGVTKTISKKVLVQDLEASIAKLSNQIKGIVGNINNTTLKKSNLSFSRPIIGVDPVSGNHLATKKYIDTKFFNVVKNDGTSKLNSALSYHESPTSFKSNELVDRNFVDAELKNVLKKIQKTKADSGYPSAAAGETFFIEESQPVFATNGPEIQEGDLLMCIEDSKGGTHGEVGHQFAIINTNVVFASEQNAGILRAASAEDALELKSEDSALTPVAYKRALEVGSEFQRTVVVVANHTLTETQKGIVGVDCRRNPVSLTLPSINRLENSKIVKYTIKDEHGNSLKNNITIIAAGGNTIQGARTYLMNANNSSVKLYNDSEGKWFVESNVTGGSETSQGVKTFVTNDVTSGEKASTTGAYESVMSIDVDLREYPVGTGFKVVSHCSTAGNGNTKTIAIGIDGAQKLPSSLTGTTAPNNQFVQHEVTVLHSDTPKTMAFGFILMSQDDSACGLSNTLDLDWNQKITISVDVLAATAATDVNVYALQVIPLK